MAKDKPAPGWQKSLNRNNPFSGDLSSSLSSSSPPSLPSSPSSPSPSPTERGRVMGVWLSGRVAASLALLLTGAVLFLVAIGTNSWAASGQRLTLGLWKLCMDLQGDRSWRCLPNKADFSLAAQAFSMVAVLCYALSFLLYLAYIVCPSLTKSRPLAMTLCLLGFSVVCLQMMTLMVFGVRMGQQFRRVERELFMRHLPPLTLAWSFIFAIVSSAMATAAGVCSFLELRNMAVLHLMDSGGGGGGVLPA